MTRERALLCLGAAAVLGLPLVTARADGASPARVACGTGADDNFIETYSFLARPAHCDFQDAGSGSALAYARDVTHLRWSSWGGAHARGRGVLNEGMGGLAPVRVTLSGRQRCGATWRYHTARLVAGHSSNGLGSARVTVHLTTCN